MKFGSREVCDVVFRARSKMTLGSRTFYKDEPVLYFDTLKTSGLEGAASSVYAQGGKGNPRLIAWEGDKTLTLTMEDALISPEGLAILAGADLVRSSEDKPLFVHTTSRVEVSADNTFTLPAEVTAIAWNGGRVTPVSFEENEHLVKHGEADIFCMKVDANGEIATEPCVPAAVTYDNGIKITCHAGEEDGVKAGDVVLVDYYVVDKSAKVFQIEITPDQFAGNFYIEGDTLYRRESDGVDMPAVMTIPNGKVQSNFSLSMANNGDPSTFTFTVDAFPAYPKFDRTKKVMAIIQVVEGSIGDEEERRDNCEAD